MLIGSFSSRTACHHLEFTAFSSTQHHPISSTSPVKSTIGDSSLVKLSPSRRYVILGQHKNASDLQHCSDESVVHIGGNKYCIHS